MPLAIWKTTVDRADAEDALRILASISESRLGDGEVEEVLDALAHTEVGAARAFRFGRPRSFGQTWIGLVPGRALDVKIFVLGSVALVEAVEERASVASFAVAAKREEYDLLRRFFLAAWDWQWTCAPFAPELRAGRPKGFDPARTAESMERVLSNARSPLLEVLRGLRRRTRGLLDDTNDLAPADLQAADAFLAGKGSATLSEIRRRYLGPGPTSPTEPPG
jgi:hypothetical protein